jgi:hypothetical protein
MFPQQAVRLQYENLIRQATKRVALPDAESIGNGAHRSHFRLYAMISLLRNTKSFV